MVNCKPFLVTPYSADDGGMTLRPAIPYACPFAVANDARDPCSIEMHHKRRRKTGPGYPLFVMSCDAHGCSFTLYPPGFAPYQRKAVACLSPCGQRVLGEGPVLQTDFRSTMFEEMLKARTANASRIDPCSRKSSRILGVGPLGDRLRERIASVLKVPALILMSLSRSSDTILEAGREVLRQLRGRRQFKAYNFLLSGHLAGCWGEPLYYDASRRIVERSPYCRSDLLERCTSQASVYGRPSPRKMDAAKARSIRCQDPPGRCVPSCVQTAAQDPTTV